MIGDVIKKYRYKRNLTQKELASLLEVTDSLISKYETNVAKPSGDKILKLIEILEIDIKEISEAKK